MALFKILNNFTSGKSVSQLASHTTGYCYFDKTTGKFWIDTSNDAAGMLQLGGTFFGTCTTDANEAAKVVTNCPGFVLYTGASIYVKFTKTNAASVALLTLEVNGTGAHPIKRLGTSNLPNTGALAEGLVCNFVYDGSNWLWVGQMDTDANTVPSAYCTTVSSTAAKLADCTGFVLADNSYIHLILANGNSSTGAITLNINGTGAKSVYLNGSVTGPSNYAIPAGSYIVYYDGSAYQLRTDGMLHGSMTGNVKSMTNDGSTIIYTMGDGTTASFVIPNTRYTAGASIKIENNSIINNGVRAVAQGTTNGTISVNTGGSTRDVSVKGLGSAAFEDAGTFALASHAHGNITSLGNVSSTATTIANGDSLLIADASDDNKLVKAAIAFDGSSTDKFLTQAGTWQTVSVNDATEAQHAGSANYAAIATTATEATHAASAGYAITAQHAVLAGTATWALDGRHANCANYAATAGYTATAGNAIFAAKASRDNDGNVITTTYATKNELSSLLATNDAMIFKGTLGTNGDFTSVPTNSYQTGYTYKIITAGQYAGKQCEEGDLLIAINDGPPTGTSIIAADWTVAQGNLDGVVIGPSSSASGSFAIFSGTTGKGISQVASKGTATLPIYIDNNGRPQTITSYEGKAGSANYATNAGSAVKASSANYAASAGSANNATEAVHAATSTYAASAGYASTAGSSNTSGTATWAVTANRAIYAYSATYVTTAQNAVHAGTAVYAASATYADRAAKDADGNTISSTYVKSSNFESTLDGTNAMQYKGTLGTGGTITALPNSHSKGDTYKVITAGTYAGIVCEAGDFIICVNNGTTAVNADWTVIQNNINGAVTGPASATDGQIAVFNGTTGKSIKAASVSKGTVVTKVTLVGGVAPTLGSAITSSYITNWNAGTTPSLTVTNVTSSYVTGWNAGTLPSATVNNGVLIFYAGTVPSLTNTYQTIGSASGWSAGTLPSMTNNVTAIPNVTNAGSSASITFTTASYVSNIA